MENIFRKIELKKINTANFTMTPVELKDHVDWPVKRIYFITDPKSGHAGGHCHKREMEFFILIEGSALALIDDGTGLREIPMSGPSSAINVPALVWHEFKNLSPDAVLVALSSTNYDPDRTDYVENYEEFKAMVKSI